MAPTQPVTPPPRKGAAGALRDAAAALVGALSALAIVLTLGLLAWAALGPGAAATGIAAAFATTAVGGLVLAARSGSSVPAAGPSSATALLLAALVARLCGDGAAGLPPLSGLLLAAGAAVFTMGVLQLFMAATGLARLVHHVPQAVLAGFMNGVALLVLLSQLPTLLGQWGVIRSQGVHPGPALLGLGTAGLVWLLAWRRPRWPASLLALLAGMAAWVLAQHQWPGLDLGPTAGQAGGGWLLPVAALALVDAAALELLQHNASAVLLTGTLLALIGSLESLMSQTAVERQFNRRPDARRELAALGLANIAGSLFAALPCVEVRARALAMIQAGAVGRRAAAFAALWSGLLFGASGVVLDVVPMAVLAGVMLTVGVALVDRWSLGLLRRWWRTPRDATLASTLLTVLVVCGLIVTWGLAVGVGVGLVLSTVMLVRGLNRSLIRSRYSGAARPSRRVWLPADEARLRPLRSQVQLLELEGSLFFGSSQRLADEAAVLAPGCRWLVLDLRRLSTVDDSGATALLQLALQLRRDGCQLVLGGLAPGQGIGHHLARLGLDPSDPVLPWFDSADLAMEHVERQLLGHATTDAAEMPLRHSTLAAGLDDEGLVQLAAAMRPRTLAAGEWLFRQGDAAESLFVVTRGSVSAVGGEGATRQRFSSLPAGTLVGETALLGGGGRSAGVVADGVAELLELTRDSLAALEQQHPRLAAVLFRNVAAHLSQRLRAATDAWHASAG